MITWFARNSVAANLLMISILAAGIFSASQFIPVEIFPTFERNAISVRMNLRGATPEDVEKGLTIRIEEAVQDLEGIERITSQSSEGSSSVNIELDNNYEARDLLGDIKSRVDAINTFPAAAERPIVSLATRRRDVIVVTLASEYGEKETREMAQAVRDDLLQISGITQIDLSGTRNYEITVNTAQDKLRQYQLTIAEVAAAIQNSSIDTSSGNLRTAGGDVLIRSKGQAYRKHEFAAIPIKTNPDGSILRLEDLATINDGFEETPVRSRFNNKNAVFLRVYRIGSQSAIDVAEKVRNYIDERQSALPTGYELSYWDDDSQIVKNRISTLSKSALQGGILVLALLTLFLRPAIAFWVFVGIPVSFMGAFLLMPVFDITLNVLSLFGFILVLGIVVDDAIVTGENIYTHLKTSESGEYAAIQGTKEVSVPVTFGILTTVAAFMPLAFIEGNRAVFFSQIPFVVVPVLLFSLIESKLVLPSHLKHLKLRHEKGGLNRFEKFQQSFADGFERGILKYYQPVLHLALRNKLTTLLLFISTLAIIIALFSSGWTRFVFFPRVPSETIRVTLTMPTGTPFEVTDRQVVRLTQQAEILRDKYRDSDTGESVITNILSRTGSNSNEGEVRFEITPPEKRELDISSNALAQEWRKKVGAIPGAESVAYRAERGRSSSPIDVQLSGSSIEALKAAADKVKVRLQDYPTVFDISDTLSDGKEELSIELTDQGKALGFSRVDLSRQVRHAFFGLEAQRIQRGRDDVRVMVRFPLDERRSLSDLEDMLIQTSDGKSIPLSHIATLSPGKGPSAIRRSDRYRTVNITADIEKGNTNMTVLEADLKQFLDQLIRQNPGINYELEGEAKEQRETFGSLAWSLMAVFFVIYILLAIPFKSYLQPFVVMSVIPFGIVGAVIGHWILGMPITILSVMGMLALSGVVVNDSLVLVDYINKRRAETGDLYEAVLKAGAARFRPVILTSLTTFIGLLPLLFEKSTQAQFLIPMAVSLAFGILFATFITLLLVPVNYLLLERLKSASMTLIKTTKNNREIATP